MGLHAQTTPAPPLAVTISGGGAKGAYMAGHLFYMGHAGRLAGQPLVPRVFTGTSAGAINSLIAVLTSCGGGEPDPTRSLYWNAWIPIGLTTLYDPDAIKSTSLLTTGASAAIVDGMKSLWDAGLPEDCDVFFGATMTRAIPRSVVLAPGLPPLPRLLETVLLRITGRGTGVPPAVRHVVDPTSPTSQVLLPIDGPNADAFGAIMQVIFASAAVPFAFSPVAVNHCLSDPTVLPRCTPADAQSALFVDGSIFDNQPLGLAVRAMRWVGRDAAAAALPGVLPDHARFYLLDPDALAYPTVSEYEEEREPEDAIGIARLLLGMVENGESSELLSVFEQEPTMRDRLLVGRTFLPQISNAFTGMLERQFREFDFYLGMYNAARSFREHPFGRDVPDVDQVLIAENENARNGWRRFACLRAVLDDVGDKGVCDGDDLIDFRILLQLSLDQMADACRRVGEDGLVETDHARCRNVMNGGATTQVPGVQLLDPEERQRKPDEDPLDFQLRLLGLYQFHFRDLGLERDEAHHARNQLIRLSQEMVHSFARAQPGDRTALAILGRIGVDVSLGYVPPRHSIHASLGLGGEIGYSTAFAGPSLQWLRFGFAVGFDGLSTIFSSANTYFTFVPKAGPELEIIGRPLAQLRFGVRGGYQFSTTDSFGSGECDLANEALRPCTRMVTEAYLSASLLGFVRFQLAGVLEPKMRSDQQTLISARPTIGIQFNSPF